MVQMALERLEGQDIVKLDDERKATMVSSLGTPCSLRMPSTRRKRTDDQGRIA